MMRSLTMLALVPWAMDAQARPAAVPCGVGPAGTTWRLMERVARSEGAGMRDEAARWLERVTVVRPPQGAWTVRVVRTALDPSSRRDSVVASATQRRTWAEARVDALPCATITATTTWRTRIPGARDSITWRVGRIVDTLGVRVAELLADREVADTVAPVGMSTRTDSAGTRTDTVRGRGILAGTESWRRLVRLDDGVLVADAVERRTTGRIAGDARLAGSASRTDRTEVRPVAPITAQLLLEPLFAGDSGITVVGQDGRGRHAWRRVGDTVELREWTADGRRSRKRVVVRDGAIVAFEDVVPWTDPPIVRWRIEGDQLVNDIAGGIPLPLPTGTWAVTMDGALELIGPVLARVPADAAWHPFTVVIPRRRASATNALEVRIRALGAHRIVHLRPQGRCPYAATALFTADWTPLLTNIGGPFGTTSYPARGTPRAALLDRANAIVTQRDLSPLVSLADQQAGRC